MIEWEFKDGVKRIPVLVRYRTQTKVNRFRSMDYTGSYETGHHFRGRPVHPKRRAFYLNKGQTYEAVINVKTAYRSRHIGIEYSDYVWIEMIHYKQPVCIFHGTWEEILRQWNIIGRRVLVEKTGCYL